MALILPEAFDPYDHLRRFTAEGADDGAVASFIGLARGASGGQAVTSLVLEHYPGFTERQIEAMAEAAKARFSISGVLIVHRVGAIGPGEAIVLCAARAAHRKPALEAVDFLMDYLKTEAPLWKRELGPGLDRWVEPRSEDYAARQAWERNT